METLEEKKNATITIIKRSKCNEGQQTRSKKWPRLTLVYETRFLLGDKKIHMCSIVAVVIEFLFLAVDQLRSSKSSFTKVLIAAQVLLWFPWEIKGIVEASDIV